MLARANQPTTWREIVYVNVRRRYDAAWSAQPPLAPNTSELSLARANLRMAARALVAEVDAR